MAETDALTHANPAPAQAMTARLPWICPSCGHFIVTNRPNPDHRCTVARTTVPLVAYIDSHQAHTIRRHSR